MTYESDAVTRRLQDELAAMKHLVVHERGKLLEVFNAFDDFRKEAADLVMRARKMNEAEATTAAVELTKLSSKAASKLTMVCVALATEDCGCALSVSSAASVVEKTDSAPSPTPEEIERWKLEGRGPGGKVIDLGVRIKRRTTADEYAAAHDLDPKKPRGA